MDGYGGTAGNEILTSATGVALAVLLVVEGITIVAIGSMRNEHMFIGMALIPPVLLKLGSTGYRFTRYYTGAREYRVKGPPPLGLRLLGPPLVILTVVVFASGVALLAMGHRSDTVFTVHKVSFIAWGVVFGVHFLAHLPRVVHSMATDWTRSARRRIAGAEARVLLLAASLGGGLALALAVLPTITGWHGHHHG